jgi:hypothetical protein
VSSVKYELGISIPEDGILHSHRRENLKSYTYKIVYGFIMNDWVPEDDGNIQAKHVAILEKPDGECCDTSIIRAS